MCHLMIVMKKGKPVTIVKTVKENENFQDKDFFIFNLSKESKDVC